MSDSTLWDVWSEYSHGDLEDGGPHAVVKALDERHAAELFVERYEANSCEYQVASGRDTATVRVRQHGTEHGGWVEYEVHGEPCPHYVAARKP